MLIEQTAIALPPATLAAPHFESGLQGSPYAWGRTLANLAYERPTDPEFHQRATTLRGELASMEPGMAEFTAGTLCLNELPLAMKAAVVGHDSDRNPADYTSHELLTRLFQQEDGVYAVPDETLGNVAEWHNYRLSKVQAEFAQDVEKLKERFTVNVRRAVEAGRLPQTALENLDRLGRTAVYIDDGFYTTARRANAVTAVFTDGSYAILMGADDPVTETHELTHVAIEGEAPIQPDEEGMRSLETRGLLRIFGGGAGGTILSETITDLIAHSLESGERISLDALPEGSHYQPGAEFIRALCTFGKKPLDVQLFVEAHCEASISDGSPGPMAIQLLSRLRQAFPAYERNYFGTDIIFRISSLRGGSSGFAGDILDRLATRQEVERLVKELRKERNARRVGLLGLKRWLDSY